MFGRLVMPRFFSLGNQVLNDLMKETAAVGENECVLEIGFGPGKLMAEIAAGLDRGIIEGIDFSDAMTAAAEKRNKRFIADGIVKINRGDFEHTRYRENSFDKVLSAHTVYFWRNPETILCSIHKILKPGGKLLLGFGERAQMERGHLSPDVFRLYSKSDVLSLLERAGFSAIQVITRKRKSSIYHCAVASK